MKGSKVSSVAASPAPAAGSSLIQVKPMSVKVQAIPRSVRVAFGPRVSPFVTHHDVVQFRGFAGLCQALDEVVYLPRQPSGL